MATQSGAPLSPQQVSDLAYQDFDERALHVDMAARIARREALLADLPTTAEYRRARADLLYTLGALYRANGGAADALTALQEAVALVPDDALMNGL
ncbi:MAG: hypothetical protein U0768_17210 [Anaerolineae bacterium]